MKKSFIIFDTDDGMSPLDTFECLSIVATKVILDSKFGQEILVE